jgi:ribosomal protein S18 acetylase RimI-like enzyme
VGARYERFDAVASAGLVDELVAVYRGVYAGEPGLRGPNAETGSFFGVTRYRAQLAGHRGAPGWQVVTARVGSRLVGYAYGFPLGPATGWWRGLTTAVPAGFTAEDGRRTFAVSEVMVLARWRRQGIGRALVGRLLADRPEQRATLLVEPRNAPAQAAYRAWGWAKVAELRPAWPEAPHYDVLVLPLGAGDPT